MHASPPYKIVTDRLLLKPCELKDAELIFKNYTSDGDASEFLQRLPHDSIDKTKSFIHAWGFENWGKDKGQYAWSIHEISTQNIAGLFLLKITEKKAEIHYGLGKLFWKKGYMTEAALGVMDWIRGDSNIDVVSTVCDVANVASMSVLEKLGMKRVNLLKNHLYLPLKGKEKRDAWLYTWQRPFGSLEKVGRDEEIE